MINNQPLVSVIMPVYNCESTISEAIDSIVNQTYKNWKLIICDDCSTDNTYAVMKKYQQNYSDKIFILQNTKNSKIAATLNHCLEHVSGEYVARMDGDDISILNRLEEQVRFLEEHSEYDLVGTQMISFCEAGDQEIKKMKKIPEKNDLRFGVPFAHATIMCHAYVYQQLNGYTVSDKVIRCEDVDLWFRFFHNGFKGYNLQMPLYRVREDTAAYKRRTMKHSLQTVRTMAMGFRLLNYPFFYYIFLLKPIASCLLPEKLKCYLRTRNNK